MKQPKLSTALYEYATLLGIDAGQLLDSYAKPIPDSFRVNTIKADESSTLDSLKRQGFVLTKIPWTQHGYIADKNLSETRESESGAIYLQGPVSMAVAEALAPTPSERILDLCAAPGSKSVQILQMLSGEGTLVANESNEKRARALDMNLQKSGAKNYGIVISDGRTFTRIIDKFGGPFDRVLVDAPCSGLGIASKDWKIARDWSLSRAKRMTKQQYKLMLSGFNCLRAGGTLVYSTCTLTVEENEMIVDKLLRKTNAVVVGVQLNGLQSRVGITEWKRALAPQLEKCLRIYPFDNGAEGFFIAKIMKPE